MKSPAFRLLIAAAALGASAAHAQTQTQTASTDTMQIPDLQVEASRGMQLRDMDVSTTVMTREEVQAAPENTVDQMLNRMLGLSLPSVPTEGVHPTGQSITMRGFGGKGAERTLVMVDGIPINDAFFRYVDWTKVPKEAIERIEVIRGGGATSLWGNMAMGGVVNIVTRDPKPGEKWFTGAAGAGPGNGPIVQLDGGATLFANDQWKAAFTASYLETAGYNETPSQFQNQHTVSTKAESYNVGGQVIWTPTPDARFYVKSQYHSILENGLVFDVAKNGWTGVDLTFGGKYKLADGGGLDANGWYGKDTITTHNNGSTGYTYTKPATGDGNAIYVGAIGKTPYDDFGGSVVWGKDLAPWLTDVKFGVDAREIQGGDSTGVLNQAGVQTAYSQVHGQQNFEGVFLQGTFRLPWLPLDVTIGLREDFWKVSDGSFNGSALPAGQQYTRFDPRIGLKYHVTPNLDLRAAAYRDFGAPGMNQTFRTYFSGTSAFQANAALAPEYNQGVETGADWRIGQVTLSGTAFYNQLTSVIDSASICGTSGGLPSCASLPASAVINPSVYKTQTKYYNVGAAQVEGLEAMADWRINAAWKVDLAGTVNNAWLTSNSGIAAVLGQKLANKAEPLNSQLANVAPYTILAGVTWTPDETHSVMVGLKGFPAFWGDTAHTTRDDGAAVLNLAASWHPVPAWELFLTGQNISNRIYYATGPSTSTTTPPTLAAPMLVLAGMRFKL